MIPKGHCRGLNRRNERYEETAADLVERRQKQDRRRGQAYRGAPPGYIIVTDQLQADHSAGRIRINNKRRDGIKEVALIGAVTWAGSAVIGGGFGLLMNWAGAPHWGALGFSAVVSMISWRNITDLLEQSRN